MTDEERDIKFNQFEMKIARIVKQLDEWKFYRSQTSNAAIRSIEWQLEELEDSANLICSWVPCGDYQITKVEE